MVDSYKFKRMHTYITPHILVQSNLTPRHLFKRNEGICPHRDFYINIHSGLIHISDKQDNLNVRQLVNE